MGYCFLTNKSNNKIKQRQIEVFKQDNYLIDEYQNDELVQAFYQRNVQLKQTITKQNEEQNKWVHDIKIPLTTLKLFIENQRNNLSSDKISILELIAIDIENDINKKIMYDKIEFEIDDFKIDKFNLTQLIKEVIKKFKPNFILKELSINLELADIYVNSDERSIRYCLEQVISNSIKYSYDKTTINIKLDETTLIIENDGVAVDSQDINRLFEQGYTGKNSLSSGMASTGLGLYLTKKNLNHLNHDIVIESKDNKTQVLIDFKKVTKM